jgi:hypothetical protein
MADKQLSLGERLKLMSTLGTMESQYEGVLPPEKLPQAKNRLAEIEQSITTATPRNSCGTALLRLSKRARLLKAQIIRSERA